LLPDYDPDNLTYQQVRGYGMSAEPAQFNTKVVGQE